MEIQTFDPKTFSDLDAELDGDIGFNPIPVRVKINHPGALFDIPGMGNMDTLEVVVLSAMRVRVLFGNMGTKNATKEISDFTGNRPLCSSSDYVNGELVDSNWDEAPESAKALKAKISEGALVCSESHCPLNKWGSIELMGKEGRGKACAELRRMCIWKPGWSIPVILTIPTSSIKAWDEYCSALVIGDLKPHYVTTKMTLEAKSFPGVTYSVVKFKLMNIITPEMNTELLARVNLRGQEQSLIKSLVDIFKDKELVAADYSASNDEDTPDADDLAEDF